jgi:Flp pilus assembly pilin Flp
LNTEHFLMLNLRSHASRGAALVEYGFLVGLVAVVAIASVSQLGVTNKGVFENVARELGAVTSGTPTAETDASEPVPARQIENQVTFLAEAFNGGPSIGWQDVSPTFGAGSSDIGPNHEVVGVFTDNDRQDLTVKFRGDTSSLDVSEYKIACSSNINPEGWERDFPAFDIYISGQAATQYRTFYPDLPLFQHGEDVSCTITSPAV